MRCVRWPLTKAASRATMETAAPLRVCVLVAMRPPSEAAQMRPSRVAHGALTSTGVRLSSAAGAATTRGARLSNPRTTRSRWRRRRADRTRRDEAAGAPRGAFAASRRGRVERGARPSPLGRGGTADGDALAPEFDLEAAEAARRRHPADQGAGLRPGPCRPRRSTLVVSSDSSPKRGHWRVEAWVDALRRALALWRGEPLAGLCSTSRSPGRRWHRLEELRLATLEDWSDAVLAAGGWVELVPELRAARARSIRCASGCTGS